MFRVRTSLVLPVVLFVWTPLLSAQDKPNYMPLKVGNKWTFKADFGGQTVELAQKVVKVEKKDGRNVATIEMDFAGQTVTEQTGSDERGVFRYSFQGVPVDPPVQALKLPFKKGESWEASYKVQGQEVKATMKSEAEEEVSVPAGKYKALVVATEMDLGGQKISVRTWFAPNVGIVKQTFDFGGVAGTSELAKFETEDEKK
ncbi:MAG: hypothetical protein NZM31_08560 [Gemmatales bacterium]|nr:hypothetical protein [Gemmatales bacterium]MDW8387043.1 hypothetical protein [Gemmatales bacterium]